MCVIVVENIKLFLSTLDYCEVFLFQYFVDKVLQYAKKDKKYSFLHTVTIKKEKLNIDPKYITAQFEIFHQQIHTSFKNKYFVTTMSSK